MPNFGFGGAERMVVHLMTGIDRDRFDVRAVSLFDAMHEDIRRTVAGEGLSIRGLGKRRGPDPRMFTRIVAAFRSFRPHVLHTHRYALRYALPAILLRGPAAAVHTVHNPAESEVGRLDRRLHAAAFRHGVVPVAIAQEIAASLRRVYGIAEAPLIPNGIPVAAYAAGDSDWRAGNGFDASHTLVVSVARLSPQKRLDVLLRAFARMSSRASGARLLLVGDGAERAELESLAARLGLAERVRFMGFRDDIRRVLAAADVFALSSDWEGNPLSVMEAMAAGLPVVSTAVGGIPELADEGVSGLLVPPGNDEALARALEALVVDGGMRQRMGQAGRARARLRFDVSLMARRYEALYERLV